MAAAPSPSTAGQRVLVVDDHGPVIDGMTRAIAADADLVFLGWATNVAEACRVAREQRPDVVIVDCRRSDGSWALACAAIRLELPDAGIVMLTGETHDRPPVATPDAGSDGSASTESAPDESVETHRCRLTRREFEVVQLLADGYSTNDIVDELVLSVHTVRNHIRNILAKLGARSRLEAVAIATRLGLVRVTPPHEDADDDAAEGRSANGWGGEAERPASPSRSSVTSA